MTVHLAHLTPTERRNTSVNWAMRRAMHSERPAAYMNNFEAALKEVVLHGEDKLVNDRSEYKDSVQVAAEIEALAARRALLNWGTREGLYIWTSGHRNRKIKPCYRLHGEAA